jgi:glycosyltransferase involved in cell wall biosynthesis
MEITRENKRLKIGIIFNFSPKWMGGIVYIINLIKTLDFLTDEDKPEIILFYRADLKKFVDEISYPYLKVLEWEFPSVYKGYLKSWLSGKNIFIDNILRQFDLDGIYPLHDFPVRTRTRTKLVSWYADLQHKYYPEFFTRRKILERNARIKLMLRNTSELVVSSQTVADDFHRFFRLRHTLTIHIYHFVSVVDSLDGMDINEILTKYRLPSRYFMISNQFHKHKNHIILFKALALMKKKGLSVHFAITGKFPDETHSQYIKELHEIIEKNNLQEHVSFIGVIPRKEQLLLMKHSQAVIQPSLFEGWSTVIEDALSVQVPVIASKIPVNFEQLGSDGVYFNANEENKLAEILCEFPEREIKDFQNDEYTDRISNAAKVFIDIFRN